MIRLLTLFLIVLLMAFVCVADELDTRDLPPRSVLPAVPDRPAPNWVKDNLRIGHLPPLGWRMLDEYLESGYNVLIANALRKWDIVGPSAHLYEPAEVEAADAYIRRFVDAVHARDARAVLYIGPVQVAVFSKEWSTAHPEWLKTKSDGTRDEAFANVRNPQFRDWLAKQLAYLVEHYGVDGFWWDGYAPVHLHTYDADTLTAFREISGGREIPKRFQPVEDAVSRQYLAWHEDYVNQFADQMRSAIRNANPEAVIFANYSANRTWYFPSMYMGEYPAVYTRAIDVPSVELYWDNPGDALYQQFCYAFMAGVKRNGPATTWIQPNEHGITGVSSEVEIQLRGLAGLPWGVYSEFVESTGREEYLKLHLQNTKAREQWLARSQPLPYIGVVASEQTRTLYGQAALSAYFSHTLGAFRALHEEHLPIQVFTEYELEDAALQDVKVLVLPNVAVLSDRAVRVIERFVAAGGGLVATFETSLYTPTFEKRDDFALAELLGVHYQKTVAVSQRTEQLSLSIRREHPVVSSPVIAKSMNTSWRNPEGPPPAEGDLALVASATVVQPIDEGEVLATYRDGQNSVGTPPAMVVREYGKGRVVYFAAAIDKGMFFFPDGYMRAMLSDACRWAARTPEPVSIRGPRILGTTVRRQPEKNRLIVHLLNDASSWGRHSIYQKIAPLPAELIAQRGHPDSPDLRGTYPIREEIIPLHDIEVVVRDRAVQKATLQPENLPLSVEQVPDGHLIRVPRIHMHSMVVIE